MRKNQQVKTLGADPLTYQYVNFIVYERMNGKMSKRLSNAKFIVRVESDKNTKQIKTVSVLNNRTNEYKDEKFIQDRGISWFLNLDDLKETLNWNLNGDSSKYVFKWGQSSKTNSDGIVYIFD